MKDNTKQIKAKGLKTLADCAMKMTSATVNSACFVYLYQDELPKEAKKLRKF